MYERAKFNNCRQELKEPVESFVTALCTLAEHCGYETVHDEVIRNRIVVGIQDRSSQKTPTGPDPHTGQAICNSSPGGSRKETAARR